MVQPCSPAPPPGSSVPTACGMELAQRCRSAWCHRSQTQRVQFGNGGRGTELTATSNRDDCCQEPTACTPANSPKRQPPTHLLYHCLTAELTRAAKMRQLGRTVRRHCSRLRVGGTTRTLACADRLRSTPLGPVGGSRLYSPVPVDSLEDALQAVPKSLGGTSQNPHRKSRRARSPGPGCGTNGTRAHREGIPATPPEHGHNRSTEQRQLLLAATSRLNS